MAQKREKKETELKVPESLPICTISSLPQISAERPTGSSDPKASGPCQRRISSAGSPEIPDLESQAEKSRSMKRAREATRCSGSDCRKRVGLMGFRCRCGDLFCSEHRYSDRHDCSYDYKAAGRETIARENPVVRAAKLVKV
ncbi:hypothetical protein CASFOL_035328 [Castilleja foliolosa]|uniref:AN1-type domain-containing protein n=1 Tax=Castilleja foliolosa TaxID=1961234 RepID=A0ABD3BTI5_9LAMI